MPLRTGRPVLVRGLLTPRTRRGPWRISSFGLIAKVFDHDVNLSFDAWNLFWDVLKDVCPGGKTFPDFVTHYSVFVIRLRGALWLVMADRIAHRHRATHVIKTHLTHHGTLHRQTAPQTDNTCSSNSKWVSRVFNSAPGPCSQSPFCFLNVPQIVENTVHK